MSDKIKGTNDGFKKEKELVISLNKKYFKDLNKNHKEIIKRSFSEFEENEQIICSSTGSAGTNKPDFVIKIGNEKYSYSFKTGSGNAIHQESLSTFLEFCKKLEGCTQSLIDCIKFFIWTDGTTDGTGKIKDRMNKIVWKKKYPKKLNEIKKFFLRNKIQIIEKVLFEGRKNNITDYFVYKKKDESFIILKSNDVIKKFGDWVNGIYGLGPITFQTWNPALQGQTKKPRDVVQFKWGKIEKDLDK